MTVGPDLTHNGGEDAFVAKVATIALSDLTALVNTLPLNGGVKQSLKSKLTAVDRAIGRGNLAAARGILDAFIAQVLALAGTGQLPGAVADDLIALAQAIIAQINGG